VMALRSESVVSCRPLMKKMMMVAVNETGFTPELSTDTPTPGAGHAMPSSTASTSMMGSCCRCKKPLEARQARSLHGGLSLTDGGGDGVRVPRTSSNPASPAMMVGGRCAEPAASPRLLQSATEEARVVSGKISCLANFSKKSRRFPHFLAGACANDGFGPRPDIQARYRFARPMQAWKAVAGQTTLHGQARTPLEVGKKNLRHNSY
jgi:hypothetical protein